MGQMCNIIDTDTGLEITRGYIRNMTKVAVIEVPNLKQYVTLQKPLKRLHLVVNEGNEPIHGLVYSASAGTNTCIINIISSSSVERRNKYRVEVDELISLEVGLGTRVKTIQSTLLNISQGGLAFSTLEDVKLGNTVRYNFTYKDHQSLLMGKVIWGRPVGDGFSYGVKFSHITPKQEKVLYDFVMDNLKDL